MPTFMNLFTYDRDSWRAMLQAPEDRSEAARKVVEAAGGRLEGFYWMLGEHDGVVIYSVPGPDAAVAVSAAIAASGRVERMQTTQLLTGEETVRALERARAVTEAYDPPGGREWRADYDEGVTVR